MRWKFSFNSNFLQMFRKNHWNQWIEFKIQCHAVIYLTLFDCSSRTIKYLKILPKTFWEEKVENLGQERFQIVEKYKLRKSFKIEFRALFFHLSQILTRDCGTLILVNADKNDTWRISVKFWSRQNFKFHWEKPKMAFFGHSGTGVVFGERYWRVNK